MSSALLLSGGLDSLALAWEHRPTIAITVDYGQLPAHGEIRAAKAICSALNLEHRVVRVDCRAIGSGDLLGTAAINRAPVSEWWPYRNQLLVTVAGSTALEAHCSEILVGSVSGDGLHADGLPRFYELLSAVMEFQEGKMKVRAPSIHETTIELYGRLSVPREIMAWTHSCHKAELACGSCRGCSKHRETMFGLGYEVY